MPRLALTDRRELLLDSALRVVARHGVAGATTRAIVAEAGVSLASFHYAFDSRDDLLAELVGRVVADEGAILGRLELRGGSMRATLREGLLQYLDLVRADPLHERAMLELTQFALRSPGLEPLAREQYARYNALAAAALDAAAESTGLCWVQPVAQLAPVLVALIDGLTLAWLVTRDDQAAVVLIDFAADSFSALAVAR